MPRFLRPEASPEFRSDIALLVLEGPHEGAPDWMQEVINWFSKCASQEELKNIAIALPREPGLSKQSLRAWKRRCIDHVLSTGRGVVVAWFPRQIERTPHYGQTARGHVFGILGYLAAVQGKTLYGSFQGSGADPLLVGIQSGTDLRRSMADLIEVLERQNRVIEDSLENLCLAAKKRLVHMVA